MAQTLSKEALKAMGETLTAKRDDANPFVREGETTFMRHDELRVIQRSPGLVDVEFRWRGMLTYTMHVDCDFGAMQELNLTGIEGRMATNKRALKPNA